MTMAVYSRSCWGLRSQIELHGAVLSALQTVIQKTTLMLFITAYVIGQTNRQTDMHTPQTDTRVINNVESQNHSLSYCHPSSFRFVRTDGRVRKSFVRCRNCQLYIPFCTRKYTAASIIICHHNCVTIFQ